jgi:uncharacterized protein YuzE
MNIKYDDKTDSIYFIVSSDKPFESEEIEKGIIIDYNENGNVVAIEILNFKEKHQNVNLPILGDFSLVA